MSDMPKILTGKRRTRFAFLVANGAAQACVAVAIGLLTKAIFDTLPDKHIADLGSPVPIGEFLHFGLQLLAVIILGAGLRWRAQWDAEQLGQSYIHSVRLKLFEHVVRLGAAGVQQVSTGAVMLRFVGDLSALKQWVSHGLARLAVSGLAAVLAISTLAVIEPIVALSVAIAGIIAAGLTIGLGRHLRSAVAEARRRRGKLANHMNDRLINIGVVEAFGQEQRERRRIRTLSRDLRRAMVHRAYVTGLLRGLVEASTGIATLCALIGGGILVNLGYTTRGGVVAAMVVTGLLAPRLAELGRVYEYWINGLVARKKQEELLAMQPIARPKRKRRTELSLPSGELALNDIRVGSILNNISVSVRPGQRLAIVGPNGSGKSTLLKVIAGLLSPDEGIVTLGGQNLDSVKWSERTRAFALVSPDLQLLRGTVRHNLLYGAQEISADRFNEVVKSCGLDGWLTEQTEGFNTVLRNNGQIMSTGERARIALARALLVKPQVLLLDEADANFDESSNEILDRLIRAFPGIVVFTTHSRNHLFEADEVLHLADGQVLARGSPAEVMCVGTPTARLFKAPLQLADGPSGQMLSGTEHTKK